MATRFIKGPPPAWPAVTVVHYEVIEQTDGGLIVFGRNVADERRQRILHLTSDGYLSRYANMTLHGIETDECGQIAMPRDRATH